MFFIFFGLFLVVIPGTVRGQTSTSTSGTELKSTQFDTSDFPGWAKDLRRAEIVAFGSFPFTLFFTTFAMDIYRTSSHNGDSRYYPWPLKPAGSVAMTKDELVLTMSIAAAGSVVVSLVDYFIVKYKQHKRERELEKATGESPIILRSRHSTEEEIHKENGVSPGEGDFPEEEAEVPAEAPVSGEPSDRFLTGPEAEGRRP
ncbi:MAG: hypothetical protein LBT93_00430 [Treponema sp.]|nr:hypothetical protein [Treponema sp.]